MAYISKLTIHSKDTKKLQNGSYKGLDADVEVTFDPHEVKAGDIASTITDICGKVDDGMQKVQNKGVEPLAL